MNYREDFLKIAQNGWKFGLFMLFRLPLAFIAGLRLRQISTEEAQVTIRYKWLTQNPFGSLYFAALAMAAELATGVLAIMNIHKIKPTVSMLVFDMDAHFSKKAVGRITFRCQAGAEIAAAVKKAMDTQEGQTVSVKSIGTDESGDVVASFTFVWTFKQKAAKKA